MLQLTPHECRVLGVLVEKAQTTPGQYPLTLNALVSGCNQRNNREPILDLSEEQVQIALDGLRQKGLAREVMLSGSRVDKFRHVAREALEIETRELVILAELLMRGPQTIGELRGRAARMHPLETVDVVSNLLESLMNRPEPLVRQLPPAPGDRAPRFAQLLCPSLHPLDAPAAGSTAHSSAGSAPRSELLERIEHMESEIVDLKRIVERLAHAVNQPTA
jgi:uncharacterized protein YceH (UPF0502 family)